LKRFEDYKQAVILAYQKKKNEGKLPRNLLLSTPANLKKECMQVFPDRYSDRDMETFSSLFEPANNAGEYLQKIRKASPDKFKPLDLFLKKDTKSGTSDKNIELLAWLIDFEPRPYRPGDIYDLVRSDMESSVTQIDQAKVKDPASEENIIENAVDDNEIFDSSKDTEALKHDPKEVSVTTLLSSNDTKADYQIPPKFNKTILAFIAAFVILMGSYLFFDRTKQEYMYWDGSQYKAIAYDQKVDGSVIVPLDTFRLLHLKKIKNTAAITRNAIGKVHYSKINGKVEFYTTGGENPEDSNRRLLPMTEYMFEKYVLHKEQ